MSTASPVRMTPWVGRLMAANVGVLVLLMAVFTDPAFRVALQFDPAAPLARPWTILTHLFVHTGPLHLALNLVFLYIFGPTVEGRLGAARFLRLYLGAGTGAAGFGILLAGFVSLPPLLGASGAILGIALAYALLWPDAELEVFPVPVPLSAATLLAVLVVLDILGALRFADDGLAHFAHLGGLVVAYGWFRISRLARSRPPLQLRADRHPVLATQPLARHEEHGPVVPPPAPARPEPVVPPRERARADLDRLLDKISASGYASLSVEERQQLKDISARLDLS